MNEFQNEIFNLKKSNPLKCSALIFWRLPNSKTTNQPEVMDGVILSSWNCSHEMFGSKMLQHNQLY